MAANISKQVEMTVEELANEIERAAGEIELKLKLGGMDARDTWERKLEPRLFEARMHAREAKEASKQALHDTLAAIEELGAAVAASTRR